MSNNIAVKDGAGATQTVKTTDNAGVHTPHHNVDTLPALPAGENHVGEVGGNTDQITPTLAVATLVYSSGNVVGGKLTLTNAMRVSGGTGILQSLLIIDNANQKAAFDILLFNADPSAGTYTDRVAFTFNVTDRAKLVRRVSVAATDYVTVGGVAIADISPGGKVLKAVATQNLFAIIVTTGTPTYAATTDLVIRFGILRD